MTDLFAEAEEELAQVERLGRLFPVSSDMNRTCANIAHGLRTAIELIRESWQESLKDAEDIIDSSYRPLGS